MFDGEYWSPLSMMSAVNCRPAFDDEYWPNFGYTDSGLFDPDPVLPPLLRTLAPPDGGYAGMPRQESYRIDPEKSRISATSRGRWAAVAMAAVAKLVTLNTRLKKVELLVALTVTRTRLYGSL